MDCAWPQGAGSDLIESRAVTTTAFSQISRIVRFRGKFAVTWHDGGKRHRHSLMTDNRAEADQRLARFVASGGCQGHGRVQGVHGRRCLGRIPPVVGRQACREHDGIRVAAARSHLGNRNAATLNEADCNAYTAARRARGRSDSTMDRARPSAVGAALGREQEADRPGAENLPPGTVTAAGPAHDK
jgi:hypothetical protein